MSELITTESEEREGLFRDHNRIHVLWQAPVGYRKTQRIVKGYSSMFGRRYATISPTVGAVVGIPVGLDVGETLGAIIKTK